MTNKANSAGTSPIGYRKRALTTFAVAVVVGPPLGLAWALLANAAVDWRMRDPGGLLHAFMDLLPVTYALGGPFAGIVGFIAAAEVWKKGHVPLMMTATAAFAIPIMLVPLFGIFYAVPALLATITLQRGGTCVARRFFGVTS